VLVSLLSERQISCPWPVWNAKPLLCRRMTLFGCLLAMSYWFSGQVTLPTKNRVCFTLVLYIYGESSTVAQLDRSGSSALRSSSNGSSSSLEEHSPIYFSVLSIGSQHHIIYKTAAFTYKILVTWSPRYITGTRRMNLRSASREQSVIYSRAFSTTIQLDYIIIIYSKPFNLLPSTTSNLTEFSDLGRFISEF